MTVDERDLEFVAALRRERPTLQGTAYLLLDDPRAAADVLDATLAQLYARQVPASALRLEALRSLVRDDAEPLVLPWRRSRQFELVDGPPAFASSGIVVDLGQLPRDQRAAIVLERFTELPSVQIADLLARPVDEVLLLARQARAALVAAHAERRIDGRLAEELRVAIPYDWRTSDHGQQDLAHGQRLVRRRRRRRSSLAAAAVLGLVALTSQLWPSPAPVPEASGPVVSSPPPARASCDTHDKACQVSLLQEWQAQTASITNAHLDPDQRNAFSYNRSDVAHFQTAAFWSGHGGALNVELFRIDRGITQVSVQIASSEAYALRCGETTHTTCVSMEFMDGHTFTFNAPDPGRGLEVQYSPDGTEMITVIARNTKQSGTRRDRALTVTRAELMDLVTDDQLRLPNL
jgi:hypothetical protein